MRILAIDPGPKRSAFLEMGPDRIPERFCDFLNDTVIDVLRESQCDVLAIEMIDCFGMAVGKEIFETVLWTGRFIQAFDPKPHSLVYRMQVKSNICHSAKATDSNIRQALIDRYGGQSVAIGGVRCGKCHGKGWFGTGRPTCPECNGECWKCKPGPLCNVSGDLWSALAIAVTWWDGGTQERAAS